MLVCPPAGVGRIEIPSCDFEAWKCDLRAAAQVPKHAAIAGWLTAEIGRQPWVVYNLMRTKEAVSAVSAEEVIISLILLVLAYGVTFGFYLYYLFKTMRKGFLVIGRDEVEHHAFQYMTDTSGEER
jgi:cytochrome d ubiquinol oxidase subunit I